MILIIYMIISIIVLYIILGFELHGPSIYKSSIDYLIWTFQASLCIVGIHTVTFKFDKPLTNSGFRQNWFLTILFKPLLSLVGSFDHHKTVFG